MTVIKQIKQKTYTEEALARLLAGAGMDASAINNKLVDAESGVETTFRVAGILHEITYNDIYYTYTVKEIE